MRSGFTLVELLLVLALMSVIAYGSFSIVQTAVFSDARDTSARMSIQALRRAQRSAQNLRTDGSWGVLIASESATVFQGDSFAGRNAVYDEIITFPGPVDVSGMTEFVFDKGTGVPASIGTMSFTFADELRHITVNELGTVIYVP